MKVNKEFFIILHLSKLGLPVTETTRPHQTANPFSKVSVVVAVKPDLKGRSSKPVIARSDSEERRSLDEAICPHPHQP